MKISNLLLICALCLSGTAAYYSIAGLATIFASAFWPVVAMAGILEISKLVVASWLYQKWQTIPTLLKTYLTTAVLVLMFITSLGIFGFLSKAHVDAGLGNLDVNLKIEQLDGEIAQAKEISTRYQSQLTQLDKAINIQLDANRAAQAMAARKQQEAERNDIRAKLDYQQKSLQGLLEKKTQLRQELTVIESKVGPIKYIAEFFADGKDVDLDQAVRWMIVIIVLVFDPLAVLMLIAANISLVKDTYKITESPSVNLPVADKPLVDKIEPNTPHIGQTMYNPVDNSFLWWTGDTWKELPKAGTSPTPVETENQPPNIIVTPPAIDIDLIRTVVTESMDVWLTKALDNSSIHHNSEAAKSTNEDTYVNESNQSNEPNDLPESIEKPVDDTITTQHTEDGQHNLDHFKPTHITYGRRI